MPHSAHWRRDLAQVDPPFSDRAFCYNLGFVGRSGGFPSEKRRSSTDSTVACERGWSAPAPSLARSCRLHARTGALGNFDPAVLQFVHANSSRPKFPGHWRATWAEPTLIGIGASSSKQRAAPSCSTPPRARSWASGRQAASSVRPP